MPTPKKSVEVLKTENKSHLPKSDMASRENAEKALMSGTILKERKEVKHNKIAHSEFMRINKLLKNIGKNDALLEPIINRYCMLQAECFEFVRMLEEFRDQRNELQTEYREGSICDETDGGLKASTYYRLLSEMQKSIVSLDRQIQVKRKMLFDIERENGMTIAAATRTIPPKADKEENPLLKALKGE